MKWKAKKTAININNSNSEQISSRVNESKGLISVDLVPSKWNKLLPSVQNSMDQMQTGNHLGINRDGNFTTLTWRLFVLVMFCSHALGSHSCPSSPVIVIYCCMLFKINAVPILLSILNPAPRQRKPTLHTLEMYASNSAGVTWKVDEVSAQMCSVLTWVLLTP